MNATGLRLTIPALVLFGVAAAQPIPRDEIRSRTVPYVPPSQVTLREEVRLVEVPVVVRDGQRHAVAGLTRDDFEIYDEGKKQAITNFSALNFTPHADTAASEASAPKEQARHRYIALCFDDLHLDLNSLKPAKEAAERFVKTSLAPGDQVAVVTTSRSQAYEFTGDVTKLVEQIEKVIPAPQGVSDNFDTCPRMSPYDAYQIANSLDPGDRVMGAKIAECKVCEKPPPNAADMVCPASQIMAVARIVWAHTRSNSSSTLGIVDSLVTGMAKAPGQRMILLTSAGFFMGTLEPDVDRLLAKAVHAEVVINTLDARGLYGSEGEVSQGLAALAEGTGGAFYHNNNDLVRGFQQLGVAPETMYVLSFSPSEAADGRFHKLKVRPGSGKQYSVQARLGYLAAKAATAAPASAPASLDSEAVASDTLTDLPVSFTWEQWAGPPGITMIAHLDLSRLHFKPFKDRRTQKLTIVAVLLDSKGAFVAGKRSELELSFKAATFERLAKDGFPAAMTLEAPPGDYSVRAVAQDAMDNKLAAASDAVRIK